MPRNLAAETWAITGAAGKIGTTLRLGLSGHLAGLVLIDNRAIEDTHPSERVVITDLADAVTLRQAFEGVTGVIHLAAIPDEADFHDLAQVNIVGTWHVLEAARLAGVARIIYASSGRTMGMYGVDQKVGPTSAPRPDGLYAVSKVAGEALCRLYVDKFGFRATCLRIGAFKPVPLDARDLSVWLSEADAVAAVLAGIRSEGQAFEILLAYSDNKYGWADLAPGRAIGFDPRDDASDFLEGEPVRSGVAAGYLGTPQFTLERQRPFRRPTGTAAPGDPAASE